MRPAATRQGAIVLITMAALAAGVATLLAAEPGVRRVPIPPFAPSPDALPAIPPADPLAIQVPAGLTARVVASDLVYPTAITFGAGGEIYLAEAGYSYGDDAAPPRVSRLVAGADGLAQRQVLTESLVPPVTDILWHQGRLYISHRGRISVFERGAMRDIVTGLPSLGDHHNNQLAVGPDGKIYFGQGTATNSGVVGLDNFRMGWLHKFPQVCDVPAADTRLAPVIFQEVDPIYFLTEKKARVLSTSAFHPFGKESPPGAIVRGTTKASGTVLRMNADGSQLEVFASGLRNPFGLGFGPGGVLYATDAGYDDKGSRPIANAPDCLWAVRQGGWYGWPDFAGGLPVTDPRFMPTNGIQPQLLLAEHPPVEKPLAMLPPHTGPMKFDFSRGGPFGAGLLYVALAGDAAPVTGAPRPSIGYGVARIDLATLVIEPFLTTKIDSLGPPSFEHEATRGFRRPIQAKFSPDGQSLYVLDFGALGVVPSMIGPLPRPFPGTGVLWQIAAP